MLNNSSSIFVNKPLRPLSINNLLNTPKLIRNMKNICGRGLIFNLSHEKNLKTLQRE